MTGIKNRSGKATTLEAKQAKAAAGRKGGGGRVSVALPPSTATDPHSDDPVARLGRPLTWGDELKRAQVEGERTQNRRRAVEVERAEVELQNARREAAEAAGKLVERSLLERQAVRIRDAWWAAAQQVPSDVIASMPDLSLEIRDRVRRAVDAAVQAAALRVKGQLSCA